MEAIQIIQNIVLRKGVEENENHEVYIKYQVIRIRRAKIKVNYYVP